jgi:signal transduction histidine kinase
MNGRGTGAGPAQEDAWVRLMPWWHAAFAVNVLIVAAWSAIELPTTWRLPAVLALYGALVLLYLVTPGKFAGAAAGPVYLAVAFVLFGGACFIYPGASFLLFILIPHCFMSSPTVRSALVAIIGLLLLSGAGTLAYDGVSTTSVVITAATAVFSLALALLLGGYITSIIEQSKQRADLIKELERTRAELADVSRQSGALAERERLAGEILDALAQAFTSVIMLLQGAEAALGRNDLAAARRQLSLAEPAARHGLAEARSLIETLAPLPLQDASFVGAVERVCQDVSYRFGFAARVDVVGAGLPLSHNAEIVLLRVAQEALANVGRHARAQSAVVTVTFDENMASVSVHDDGVGFDTGRPAGFGLSQLRSRVGDVGGTAEVVSIPGAGTTVRVSVPASGAGQPAPEVPAPVKAP